jgi:hypothetical protein
MSWNVGASQYSGLYIGAAQNAAAFVGLVATGGGTSGGSATLTTADIVELVATGGGTSGGSAVLVASYAETPPVALATVKRMLAIGNNQVWFEDI